MPDRLIDLPQVRDKVSLGTTKIYDLMKNGQFPRPHKLGRLSRWSEAEVDAWIEMLKSGKAI